MEPRDRVGEASGTCQGQGQPEVKTEKAQVPDKDYTNEGQAPLGVIQPKEMTLLQISVRCILIFLIGLALVRIGDRRSLSQKTGFDALFIVLLGSVLSRAINGTSPFSKTVGAGLALMVIHRLFAFGAC